MFITKWPISLVRPLANRFTIIVTMYRRVRDQIVALKLRVAWLWPRIKGTIELGRSLLNIQKLL